jgi:hypothetical protein
MILERKTDADYLDFLAKVAIREYNREASQERRKALLVKLGAALIFCSAVALVVGQIWK